MWYTPVSISSVQRSAISTVFESAPGRSWKTSAISEADFT